MPKTNGNKERLTMAYKALYVLLLGFPVELLLQGGIWPQLSHGDGWFTGGKLVRVNGNIVLQDAWYYVDSTDVLKPVPDTVIPETSLMLMAFPVEDWEIWFDLNYAYEQAAYHFDVVHEHALTRMAQPINESGGANG